MSLEVYPYALLSFPRILNLGFGAWQKQVGGITHTLPLLDGLAAQRVATLQASVGDIGNYIYGQGRCAVAHASLNNSVVHPDRLADWLRMREDLPLARALAAHALESEFGVLKDLTFRSRHRNDQQLPATWLRLVNGANGTKRYAH